MTGRALSVVAGLLVLVACEDETASVKPAPVAMTEEALGHYCQMNIVEHDGPVAQVHRAGFPQPIWFSQVRDAIAYTRLPEETDEVTAFYVSDMSGTRSWLRPEPISWLDADKARFVVGSGIAGGMGAPEAIPFADQAEAEAYAAAQGGGEIVALTEIPDDYVLAPVEIGVALPDQELIR